MSRSAAQQINHWAGIGRELEAAEGVSHRDLARVLAGRDPYDSLNGHEQALVRAEWEERMTETRKGVDFEAEFLADGESWVEADTEGRTVVHDASGTVTDSGVR